MLVKRRNTGKPRQDTARLDRLKLPVMKIKMSDYKTYHHDKSRLKEIAEQFLAEPLDLDATTDLETLRKLLAKDHNMDSCCFVDCKCHCYIRDYIYKLPRITTHFVGHFLACTAERFFRIDRAQEQLHYVTDVAADAVYVLEEDAGQQTEGQIIASHEKEAAETCPRYVDLSTSREDCSFSWYLRQINSRSNR